MNKFALIYFLYAYSRSYTNYAKSQPFIVDEGSNESQSTANALSSEENENVNGQLVDKFKRFNKENIFSLEDSEF